MQLPDSLDWVSAEREHIAALQRFVCAVPARSSYSTERGRFHPCPWELEVQAGIRNLAPPLPPSEALLLGFEPSGELAVVSRMSFDLDGQQLLILGLAVRVDCRGRGYGRAALKMSLEILATTKAEYELDCAVWARIDRRNAPSQALFAAEGFENLGAADAGDLEVWVQMLGA